MRAAEATLIGIISIFRCADLAADTNSQIASRLGTVSWGLGIRIGSANSPKKHGIGEQERHITYAAWEFLGRVWELWCACWGSKTHWKISIFHVCRSGRAYKFPSHTVWEFKILNAESGGGGRTGADSRGALRYIVCKTSPQTGRHAGGRIYYTHDSML